MARTIVVTAVVGTFDLSGRARRTDLLGYLIISGIVGFFANFLLHFSLSFKASIIAGVLIQTAFYIPLPALFVRRLHDQARSGWFGLLILPAIVMQIYQGVAFATGTLPEGFFNPLNPARLAVSVFSLLCMVFGLWPGSTGENRFGPDPRQI